MPKEVPNTKAGITSLQFLEEIEAELKKKNYSGTGIDIDNLPSKNYLI